MGCVWMPSYVERGLPSVGRNIGAPKCVVSLWSGMGALCLFFGFSLLIHVLLRLSVLDSLYIQLIAALYTVFIHGVYMSAYLR